MSSKQSAEERLRIGSHVALRGLLKDVGGGTRGRQLFPANQLDSHQWKLTSVARQGYLSTRGGGTRAQQPYGTAGSGADPGLHPPDSRGSQLGPKRSQIPQTSMKRHADKRRREQRFESDQGIIVIKGQFQTNRPSVKLGVLPHRH